MQSPHTATRLNEEQVERVMSLLAGCKGKVVIVGVGKSGIIAQKIAATMTSTGTAALHLHPSDALHGGLGIVNADDVVIVLSNSGETDEIVAMLPYLKHRQVPIIAVVGNLNSTLAQTVPMPCLMPRWTRKPAHSIWLRPRARRWRWRSAMRWR